MAMRHSHFELLCAGVLVGWCLPAVAVSFVLIYSSGSIKQCVIIILPWLATIYRLIVFTVKKTQ